MANLDLTQQQGDVLIYKTNIPFKATRKEFNGPVVLAEGEVTGHAHRINEVEHVDLYELDGVMYMNVKEDVKLTHEEHGVQTIGPGEYQIGIVQTVDPFTREVLDAAD